MRYVRAAVPLLLVAGLGCSQGTSVEPPVPDEPFRPRVTEAELGRLRLETALAGKDVAESADGPWVVRATGGVGGPSAGSKSVTARSHGGSFRGPAGEIPPDSREPADAPAPKPGTAAPAETGGPTSPGGDGGAPDLGGPATGGGGAAPAPPEAPATDAAYEGEEVAKAEFAELRRDRRSASRPGPSAQPVRTLKAGATDDNADFDAYLEFLDSWVDRKEILSLYYPLDVRDRRHVRVVDGAGRPVPGAVVSIVDEANDRAVWSGTTYGDGRVPFYPGIVPAAVGAEGVPAAVPEYLVEAHLPGTATGVRARWDGQGETVEIVLADAPAVSDPLELDVLFLIDTTGSMRDEIDSIKASLLRMTEQLRSLDREFDLRYGAVLYRDIGDEYLTARHPFTDDIEAFDAALKKVRAAGGGDGPESLNQGLAEAVDGVAWRTGAAKVMFVIADAPPHMDYAGDTPYGESVKAAVGKGIRIHSVAASGLDAVGTLVFRQIAQFTRGKFIFIEYGGTAASAASHGVTGAVKSNNLEDILFEQIRDELARWGRAE